MTHTPPFSRLWRALRLAMRSGRTNQGYDDIIEQISKQRPTRRAAIAAAIGVAVAPRRLHGVRPAPSVDVGIVGAGLAGLACGWELHRRGVPVSLYDATVRAGGRCHSLGGAFTGTVTFPGQVAERGGEFIDTGHKTMIGYAREFGLTMEDVTKEPGDVAYFFGGARVEEAAVVDEFREFVAAMRRDLRTLSSAPTADDHTPADRALDLVTLREYLTTRGAGTIARKAIDEAYVAEYGLETDRQSCLNFLLFIHADRRSKFQPFGVFSDERYHVVEGNQAVAAGLANRLAGRIHAGMELTRVRKTPAGKVELRFRNGATRTHDAAVLAVPFTVLRLVELDASLALPPWKNEAIQRLGYGTNAKMIVGFSRRTWLDTGSNGSSYSDLIHHQTTWETNPSRATATRAVLTDYSGGDRGAGLNQGDVQQKAQLFLGDLNAVFPGALADATRVGGKLRVHLEHWPSNPLTRGSYTCYLPGQFTTIAGNEGKPVGNVFFAGEHANSFYEYQGFMEGALLSGIDAAGAILD
jgi:monoamine oxidase